MTQDQTEAKPNPVRSRLFSGLRWSGSSQVLQQVLNLGCSVVLARLLVPEDFGLLAMASVFTGIVFFVLDLGLGAALVQRKDIQERQISSVFWINVMVGLVMTMLGVASSWGIAAFYGSPAVQPIVALLSCNFLFSSLGKTQTSLLMRQMNFRSLELRTLIALVAGIMAAIVLAFMGFGVWSLVARILVTGAVEVITLWSVSSWRPRFQFCWADVRELVSFGNEVLLGNLLLYIGRNADNLLIGKFIGTTGLGYYALAYNVMMLPVQRASQVFAAVLFPTLSRIQEDVERVKRSWFRASRLIAAVTMPMMFGLVVLAPQFVETVYGQKWLPVVPLLQILAMSGIVQSLSRLNSTVLMSLGKVRLRLKLTFFSVAIAICSFIAGLPLGIIGVAACFAMANFLTELFFLYKTLECIGSNLGQYFRNLFGVIIASVGMSLAVFGLVLQISLATGLELGIGVLVGSASYLVLLQWAAPEVVKEALGILPDRLTKRWSSR
jgi:O-antigen/teichoic acid export membrane protein